MQNIKTSDFLEYCREQRGLGENTLRAYRQDIEAFWLFLVGRDDSKGLCSDTVLAFQKHLRQTKGNSPATIRRRIVTLRAYFEWFQKEHDGGVSPFSGLYIDLRVPQRLPRPVDRPTLAEIFRSTKRIVSHGNDQGLAFPDQQSDKDKVTGLMIRLLVVTGLRIGELTHVRLMDVSGAGTQIRVRGKGNRERTVYVTNERLLRDLCALFRQRLRASDPESFLFLNVRGTRLTEAAFRKRLRTMSKTLRIAPYLTPHQMRHSAATLLIEEGVDIRIVQRLLGHASVSTTEIYTKVSDNSLFRAIEHADTLAKVDS